RRHTRSKRDWSSDVCSSDLALNIQPVKSELFGFQRGINKGLTLKVDYSSNEDLTKKTALGKIAAAVNGKIDRLSAVEVGYSVDKIGRASCRERGRGWARGGE